MINLPRPTRGIHRIFPVLLGAGYTLAFLLITYLWSLVYQHSGVVAWHPSSGLSLGLLLVLGPTWAPLTFVAQMAAWLFIFHLPVGLTGVLVSLVTTLAYTIAAVTLRRLTPRENSAPRLRETTYQLFTAVLTAMVVATITARLMVAGGIIPDFLSDAAFVQLWVWQTLSNMVIGPLFMLIFITLFRLMTVIKGGDIHWRALARGVLHYYQKDTMAALQFLVSVMIIAWIAFMLFVQQEWRAWYMIFLPMVLVVYRFGMPGAMISISGISISAIVLAHVFQYPPAEYNNLTLFLVLLTMAGMMMGAVFSEQQSGERALRHRLGVEEIISRISARFINVQQNTFDEEIARAMGDVCAFCGVDAGHLMLVSRDAVVNKVYEWQADGKHSGLQGLEGKSMAQLPWLLAELEADRVVHLPEADHLPAGAGPERQLLREYHLRSLVTAPLHINQVLVGALGFHSMREAKSWSEEDIRMLRLVSQIFLNVIERSRAEARGRESDLKFRSLVLQSYDGVMLVDEEGRITEWNRGMERITGRQRADALGRYVWDVQFEMLLTEMRTTQTLKNLHDTALEMLATGVGVQLNSVQEYRAVRADGDTRLLQTLTFPIRANGNLLGTFVRDMTDVRMGEEELRRSRANLAEAERLARMGHFRIRVSDGMMEWSEETYRIANWDTKTPPPAFNRVLSLMLPHERDLLAEKIRKVLELGQAQEHEYMLMLPSGPKKTMYSVVRPEMDASGEVTHIFGTVMDITERKQAEEALRESELRYKELADAVSDTFFGLDWEMKVTYWNPASERLTRLSAAEALGKDVYTVFPELRGSMAEQFTLEAYRTRQHQGFVIEWPTTKQMRYMEVNIYPGNAGFSVFLRDVTERQLANERLRQSEARYRAVVEDQTDLISRYTCDGVMTFVNESYCRVMGINRSEVIGKRFYTCMVAFGNPEPAGEFCLLTGNLEPLTYETPVRLADGSVHWIQWMDRPILDDQNRVVEFQSVGRDISESKRLEEELRYLSTHDMLTGLYNRAFFESELRRFQNSRYYPISMLMADVNGLKNTNDSQGHASGDELLQTAARVLSASFRPEDIVARFGGDEFAVLLPGLDRSAAEGVLQRLRRAQDQHNQDEGVVQLSLSIGIATARRGESLTEVLSQADRRMYQDKNRQKTTKELC